MEWSNTEALDNAAQVKAINASQAVIHFKMDGTIIEANENFLSVMGYTLGEIQGKHHSMFAEGDFSASKEYKDFWAALNRGEYQAGQYKRIGKGGKEVWIEASYNPIIDMKGNPYKVVKYAVDLTRIKHKNAALADDFETNDYWGANIVNNGWEFGVPAGTVIDSAYSPDLAWKTNLNGTHDNNQTLVLYSPVFSFIHAYNAQLSFWHWIDTDAGDGGYVQYTSNGGTTWNNLGVQNDPTGTNWAPDAVNTAYGWSGHSGGWVQSSIDLSFLNFNPFETQFRFIFYSNAVGTNGDGWAIDNFEIVIPQADIDAGVIEIVSPAGTLTPGVQEPITVKIYNYGINTLTSIPVVASVNTGQPPISATWTGSLASGDTTTFTFPGSYTPVNVSDFEFCAYTDISNDYIAYNDTTCVTLYTNVGLGENNVSAISLNPNPADDFTALEFEAATSDNAVLTITSAEGKLIRETVISINAGTNNYTIETADLAPGLYHWTLRSNSSNGEGKLIINR